MRDPKRIGAILSALNTEWLKNPDQRFGQLLINLGIAPDSGGFWFVEDTATIARLAATGSMPFTVSKQDDGKTVEPVFTDSQGTTIKTHPKTACSGEVCVIHNPSDHFMREWPTIIRGDRMFLIERICDHGVGHPDPDSLAHFVRVGYDSAGVHGCDGCCFEQRKPSMIDPEFWRKANEDRSGINRGYRRRYGFSRTE